jgi:hypothetical protein
MASEYKHRAPMSLCRCGHTGDGANSEHAPTFEPGHGLCTAPGCKCEKFTWANFTGAYEAVLKGKNRKS